MNFQRGKQKEDPEINLVPMIDVLLVVLIFLTITTTYAKFSELEIRLPEATLGESVDGARVIDVSVSATGGYTVNGKSISYRGPDALGGELRVAAGNAADPMIVIRADAAATHQSVMTLMEASRMAGYNRITFMAKNPG